MKPSSQSQLRAGWRRPLLLSGMAATLYSVLVFSFVDNILIPPLHGIALASVGLIGLSICTRGNTVYYSPIVLSVLYLMGYPLKMAMAVLSDRGFVERTGGFGFTVSEWNDVVAIVWCGMAGIVFGQMVARKMCSREPRGRAELEYEPNTKHLGLWIVLWFCGSVGLNLLMWSLGIGQTGIRPAEVLPLRLAGILYYTRIFIVPLISVFLVDLALRAKNRSLANWLVVLIVLEAILFGFTSLSRALVLNRLFPLIIYLFIGKSENRHARRLTRTLLIVAAVAVLVVLPAVTTLRYSIYGAGGQVSGDEFLQLLLETVRRGEWTKSVGDALSFAPTRIVGLPGVMAVLAHPLHGLDLLFRILTSSDLYYRAYFMEGVLGVRRLSGGAIYIGMAEGLFGLLYFSGSLLVVFLGAAVGSGSLVLLEEVSRRMLSAPGWSSPASCVLGVLFAFELWETNPSRIQYALVVSLIGLVIIRTAMRGQLRRSHQRL